IPGAIEGVMLSTESQHQREVNAMALQQRKYDGDLQMFVDPPREPDMARLTFLRWLVERKRPATSTIDRDTHEPFEEALTHEIVRSETLRLSIVALILGLGLVRWIAEWTSLALGRDDMPLERSSLGLLVVVGGGAIAYELYAISVAS